MASDRNSRINMVNHNNGYNNMDYSRKTFGEPRQKTFAVMRFEKRSVTDDPGWYVKAKGTDFDEMKRIEKDAVAFPATDGQGWVSNANDVLLVEIIPTDFEYDFV